MEQLCPFCVCEDQAHQNCYMAAGTANHVTVYHSSALKIDVSPLKLMVSVSC